MTGRPPARLPADVHTLTDLFDHAARHHPQAMVGSLFDDAALTHRDLAAHGRAGATALRAAGVTPGDPVAVLLSSPLDLLTAVAAVAAAGGVLVPLSVSGGLTPAYVARLTHVIKDCGVGFAVVDEAYTDTVSALLPQVTTCTPAALTAPGSGSGSGSGSALPAVDEDAPALVQYTSGSTAQPRGVALTHRNVLAGIRALHHGVRPGPGDVLSLWLPLSHDMGLLSTLGAVAAGIDLRVAPPRRFVKHPGEWLRRSAEAGATILVGPNFGYQHLVDAVPAEEVAAMDLSRLRVLLNGAEPIDPALGPALARHLAPAGLPARALTPCYGLAEATLAVTFAPLDQPPAVDWVDRTTLRDTGVARPAAPESAAARGVVDCGTPVPGMQVRVVDGGAPLPDRTVGEVEIRGASVMRGYHQESAPTVSADGWCPTGDLGYLVDGSLYVTGRRREMLIVGGRNLYPQDVEETVRRLPGVHRRRAVAVVLPEDPARRLPARIAVLAETTVDPVDQHRLVTAVRTTAAAVLDGSGVDVVLLRRGALLRTTSGKYQRVLMRQRLLAGALDGVLRHVATGRSEPRPGAPGSSPSLP